jgi:nitrate reductase delta subunit
MAIAEYKVLSFLLSYPSDALRYIAEEIRESLHRCAYLTTQRRSDLAAMVAAMAAEDALDLQEEYVELFDRSRALSLHLFEHVHGESRDRGQAMVSLRERYQAAGFDIAANELPDYLPLFLEFLSLQEPAAAQGMLRDVSHILQALGERHTRRHSRYALLFQVLAELAAAVPDQEALKELREAVEDDPSDLAALDRAWEEAEVRFGPGDANASQSCPRAGQMLDRMQTRSEAMGDKA